MPYIDQAGRERLNPALQKLRIALHLRHRIPGDLTYCIFYLLLDRALAENSYAQISATRACAQDAADEYKRRVMDPHENKAIERNGDIPLLPPLGEVLTVTTADGKELRYFATPLPPLEGKP